MVTGDFPLDPPPSPPSPPPSPPSPPPSPPSPPPINNGGCPPSTLIETNLIGKTLGGVRVGDMTTGHGVYPPQAAFAGSPDVFINGLGAMRQFDDWDSHACSSSQCVHDGTVVITRNTTVLVNGLPLVTIGDQLDCGSICEFGSSNVFIGGN